MHMSCPTIATPRHKPPYNERTSETSTWDPTATPNGEAWSKTLGLVGFAVSPQGSGSMLAISVGEVFMTLLPLYETEPPGVTGKAS